MRSRTRDPAAPASAESSSARASSPRAVPRPSRSGNPASVGPIPGRRTPGRPVGGQPPGHEPQRLRRGAIQPLLVVDDAEQRPLPAASESRLSAASPTRNRSGGGAAVTAERRAQRVVLRLGQLVERGEQRAQSWCSPAKASSISDCTPTIRTTRQPRAHGPDSRAVRSYPPRLTPQHQGAAVPGPDGVDQPVEHVAFATPVRQPGRTPSMPEVRRHPTGSMPLRCGRPHPVDGAATRRRRPGRQTRCERSSGLPRRFRPRLREAGTCHERLSTVRVGSAAQPTVRRVPGRRPDRQ